MVSTFLTETDGAVLPLDAAALERLVEMTWLASLEPEEGRYPTPLLYVPDPRVGPLRRRDLLVRFAEPIPLSAEVIRRLAKIVPQRPHAIYVRERRGRLECLGTGVVERLRRRTTRRTLGIHLAVQQPGRLTLSGPTYPIVEWRGDRVERVRDISQAAVFREVLRTALELRLRRAGAGVDMERLDREMLDVEYEDALALALGVAIAGIRDAGRGGCVVVLPRDAQELPPFLGLTWRTRGPQVGRSLVRALAHASEGAIPEPVVSRRDLDRAMALARMGSVDGCLVLDATLRCLGFGGKIHRVDIPPCKSVDAPLSGDPGLVEGAPAFDLRSRGTRHQSAATLCLLHPGTVAFVISQDGEISAMGSPNGRWVQVVSPLGTYVGWTGTIDSA